MISDMASYLRFFDSVRRRTERDVAALPSAAAAWRPPAISGDTGDYPGWTRSSLLSPDQERADSEPTTEAQSSRTIHNSYAQATYARNRVPTYLLRGKTKRVYATPPG